MSTRALPYVRDEALWQGQQCHKTVPERIFEGNKNDFRSCDIVIQAINNTLNTRIYDNEESRLTSFESWPPNFPNLRQEMVASGLYYSGQGDMVKCHLCACQLSDWKKHHSPSQRHKKVSPNCPAVNNYNNNKHNANSHQDTIRDLKIQDRLIVSTTLPISTFNPPGKISDTADQPKLSDIDCSTTKVTGVNKTHKRTKKLNGGAKASKIKEKRDSSLKFVQQLGFSDDIINEASSCLKSMKISINCDSIIDKIYELQKEHDAEALKRDTEAEEEKLEETVISSHQEHHDDVDHNPKTADSTAINRSLRKEEEHLNELKDKIDNMQRKRTCRVCGDCLANTLFLPCSHVVACIKCSDTLRHCPLENCKKLIRGTKQVFFA